MTHKSLSGGHERRRRGLNRVRVHIIVLAFVLVVAGIFRVIVVAVAIAIRVDCIDRADRCGRRHWKRQVVIRASNLAFAALLLAQKKNQSFDLKMGK
jgi:hypothetical protein